MKKFVLAVMIVISAVLCSACGEVASLEQLRAEKQVYKLIIINRPISDVRKHLLDNVMPSMRIPHTIEESSNGERITVVSSVGYVKNYFLDIERLGEKTRLTAYQFGNGAWWQLDEMIVKLINI